MPRSAAPATVATRLHRLDGATCDQFDRDCQLVEVVELSTGVELPRDKILMFATITG